MPQRGTCEAAAPFGWGPRSAGPVGMPGTHNYGEDPEEQRKAQLVQYLRRVLGVVETHRAAAQLPIVLAAQPEIRGHLLALGKSFDFLGDGIESDPEALGPGELHEAAWTAVDSLLADRRNAIKERFSALFGERDPKALTAPEAIIEAAGEGRDETLLLAEGLQLWGRLDEPGRLIAHGSRKPGDEDLLDLAAVRTLLHGGHIEILPKNELPQGARLAAAILRY